MTADMFKLRLLRATRIGERLVLAGAEICVNAAEARALITAGRARLADEADLVALLELTRPTTSHCPRAPLTR
jgi:hypothetical protein